jgi:hypothetical protein
VRLEIRADIHKPGQRGLPRRVGFCWRLPAAEWSATGEVEVAAVARRAGVSAGLPYRYFGTRSGLLIALVDDFYGRLETAALLRSYDAPR